MFTGNVGLKHEGFKDFGIDGFGSFRIKGWVIFGFLILGINLLGNWEIGGIWALVDYDIWNMAIRELIDWMMF